MPGASGRRSPADWLVHRRALRIATVAAGIVLVQAILYGPSLLGGKIPLPLDILALPQVYLPDAPGPQSNRIGFWILAVAGIVLLSWTGRALVARDRAS